MSIHEQVSEERREATAVSKMAEDDGRVYTFNAAALRAWVAHRRPDLTKYVEQILALGPSRALPEAGLELCLAIGFTAGRRFERALATEEATHADSTRRG